ncbi:hypothetical protein PPN31114_03536 [Pandoraea pneumonica]|uniref:Uncharacterized protein n=1 Tax=Pandoraea pneumonica TaxID=2508299 RepID=A0A5E4WY77_9BURK|nr:hypothetical protein [Pandoraea pneumonica]VVE28674.1 hypothetical protein PPN31114_03536 [Pandoraea pneumonica]
MTPITFPGYSVGAREVTVIAERILAWWPIDYNGVHGTCIQLDTGKEINVRAWSTEVDRAVVAAGSKA